MLHSMKVCSASFFSILIGFIIISHPMAVRAEKIPAQMTTLPQVPPPISRSQPAQVVINLEAKEFVGRLADGIQYKFWSFNGTVPGPMIRVRVGDTIELHLSNPHTNQFPHNVDFHAVNGPGGGAGATLAAPGGNSVFSFKALAPGLYIYHCAAPVPSIPAHIANGMYGMILVEPPTGLPKVDREYAVVQSEFYTTPTDTNGIYQLSMDKGLNGVPDHVVFNGQAESLTGDGALTAKTGETIRVYFGNIGPNGMSSFHVIGEVFDKVYVEGAMGGHVHQHVQTTLVPSAGSTIVEFTVDVPGSYLLVDGSISRVAKGAFGILNVTGEDNPSVFDSQEK
ncbi:copper-containing nitrite reductase [Petrachloros mirabilis]